MPAYSCLYVAEADFESLAERQCRDCDIAAGLGESDEEEEAGERLAQHPGGDGQRISNDRGPAEQQAPPAIAPIPSGRAIKAGRLDEEPPPIAEALDAAAEQPVDRKSTRLNSSH